MRSVREMSKRGGAAASAPGRAGAGVGMRVVTCARMVRHTTGGGANNHLPELGVYQCWVRVCGHCSAQGNANPSTGGGGGTGKGNNPWQCGGKGNQGQRTPWGNG